MIYNVVYNVEVTRTILLCVLNINVFSFFSSNIDHKTGPVFSFLLVHVTNEKSHIIHDWGMRVFLWSNNFFLNIIEVKNIIPRRALENSLNTQFLISLQVNNTQYKCEIDAWILNFFVASELYIYWDQILRLLAPTIEIS